MNIITPGKHLLIDFWQAKNLTDIGTIKLALENAAKACGAKILDINLHEFGKNAGVTGVAILAESHISIHTWPETSYAALDVFMCGRCNPEHSLNPLKEIFKPKKINVTTIQRG